MHKNFNLILCSRAAPGHIGPSHHTKNFSSTFILVIPLEALFHSRGFLNYDYKDNGIGFFVFLLLILFLFILICSRYLFLSTGSWAKYSVLTSQTK